MLCHYGKRSLGHEQKRRRKGSKGKNPEEKKREKELLQNIFHQLGMLSWDWNFMVPFDGLIKSWQRRLRVECKSRRFLSLPFIQHLGIG